MSKFFVNDFQKQIWSDNYQDQNETIEDTQNRLADTIYKDEDENIRLAVKEALIQRRLFFGGRVTANTGTDVKNVFSFNCYAAQRATKPVDSIKNIFTDVHNAAEILKTEGGIGFNFNHIRPKGTLIKGVGVGTPGVVAFMEIYDKSAEIITRGSAEEIMQSGNTAKKKKIRKGAQMAMLSCFSKNTEVLTTIGWIKIDKLIEDMLENNAVYFALDSNNISHKIIHPFVKEPEPIYEIELENGTKLEVTKDHKFEVKNIETDEIYLKALKDIDFEKEFITILDCD